ncbi:hypothetical protein RRF57_011668 [Xylaria bambusicola]|uniref:Uncharacterized protein n=1 Tax=Xylaria bambusicola TaxID=326684 RepID=A0AAN7V0W3_9PEZI
MGLSSVEICSEYFLKGAPFYARFRSLVSVRLRLLIAIDKLNLIGRSSGTAEFLTPTDPSLISQLHQAKVAEMRAISRPNLLQRTSPLTRTDALVRAIIEMT